MNKKNILLRCKNNITILLIKVSASYIIMNFESKSDMIVYWRIIFSCGYDFMKSLNVDALMVALAAKLANFCTG